MTMTDVTQTPALDPTPQPPARPAISYDIPHDVSYSGRSLIDLALDPEFFIASHPSVHKDPS
jgi:hypothetical protein